MSVQRPGRRGDRPGYKMRYEMAGADHARRRESGLHRWAGVYRQDGEREMPSSSGEETKRLAVPSPLETCRYR